MTEPHTAQRPIRVLFLCTHNSARSILAEACLNHLGRGRWQAFSAGSSPRPGQQPHALALAALQEAGIPTAGLRSKNWDEFAGPQAQPMDLIITVCDNAAGELCPIWPGHPATAHWAYADPSEGEGSPAQRLQRFRSTLQAISGRLEAFLQAASDELLSGVGEAETEAARVGQRLAQIARRLALP
ncbi:MAG: arsenate reductase ArsC [Betaproteobacteria bacterium]|nr:arsenate reductase ArsC [Betaproteobacteria bacterium]